MFSAQTAIGRSGSPEDTTHAALLEPDHPVERELWDGERHAYLIHSEAGMFLHAVAEEHGVRVVLIVYDPQGKIIAVMRHPNGEVAKEQVSVITESTGTYKLEVASAPTNNDARSGHYRVAIAHLRVPRKEDKARIAAEQLSLEAQYFWLRRRPESYRVALQTFEKTLPLWREASDNYEEGLTLLSAGRIYSLLDEKQKALASYEQALPLQRAADDRSGQAQTLNNLGVIYSKLGEPQKALDYYGQALPLLRTIENRDVERVTFTNLGKVYSELGELRKALEYFDLALALERSLRDVPGQANTLADIGAIHERLGDKQKALGYLKDAVPLVHASANYRQEASLLTHIGKIHFELDQMHLALVYFDQALPLRRALKDPAGEASALTYIAVVYKHLGDKRKALRFYSQALVLIRSTEDRRGEPTIIGAIGSVYEGLGNKQKALENDLQALSLFRAAKDSKGEAATLNNIGKVYSDSGDKQKALEYYNQALPLSRAGHDTLGEATALNNIGKMYATFGDVQTALENYNQALPLERAAGNRAGEAITLRKIAAVYEHSDPDLAIAFAKRAVNILQTIRSDNQMLQQALLARYEKSIESYYRFLANLLVGQSRFAEAEEVLNLLKNKESNDFIRRDAVGDQLRASTLLEREKKALDHYDQVVDQLVVLGQRKTAILAQVTPTSPTTQQELNQLNDDLKAANVVLRLYLDDLQRSFRPDSALAKRITEFKEATGLQSVLEELGPDVVAIYTLVDSEKYVAMLVTSGARRAYTSPIKEVDLNKKIFDFRQRLQDPTSDPRPLAQELYRIVFPDGLRQDLDAMHAKTIMWSIDGTLRYIPFSALHDGKFYLVETFRQSLITPGSISHLTDQPVQPWSGVGFGVSKGKSPLPSVPFELKGIFRETADSQAPVPGVIHLNADFSIKNFEADLRQKRNPVVHIATHYDSRNAQLLLGDGQLSLADIASEDKLFHGVDLLTLSACNTAFTNRSEDGRDVESFAEIAQQLEARGVIASLWSVNDNSTSELMKKMYRLHQDGKGMTKAEALQQAQVALLKVWSPSKDGSGTPGSEPDPSVLPQWAHPYYWAPFILIGNWK